MSNNSISLVYPGGSVSQEHLESMCNTALAVQQIVKSKGAIRRSFATKDIVAAPTSAPTHRVVQIPDPAKMAKRKTALFYHMPEFRLGNIVIHEAEVFMEHRVTTWHSQYVQVYSTGATGSQNERKALRASSREARLARKHRRKAAGQKDRPSRHDLMVEALHDDFGGQYPFRVSVPQSGCKVDDLLFRSLTEANEPKAPVKVTVNITVPEAALTDDETKSLEALRRRKAKVEAKRQEELERKRSFWTGVYQRPEGEQPAVRPAEREIDERYYGSRRFLVANTRGA